MITVPARLASTASSSEVQEDLQQFHQHQPTPEKLTMNCYHCIVLTARGGAPVVCAHGGAEREAAVIRQQAQGAGRVEERQVQRQADHRAPPPVAQQLRVQRRAPGHDIHPARHLRGEMGCQEPSSSCTPSLLVERCKRETRFKPRQLLTRASNSA